MKHFHSPVDRSASSGFQTDGAHEYPQNVLGEIQGVFTTEAVRISVSVPDENGVRWFLIERLLDGLWRAIGLTHEHDALDLMQSLVKAYDSIHPGVVKWSAKKKK